LFSYSSEPAVVLESFDSKLNAAPPRHLRLDPAAIPGSM
jgi:hypothetical protein